MKEYKLVSYYPSLPSAWKGNDFPIVVVESEKGYELHPSLKNLTRFATLTSNEVENEPEFWRQCKPKVTKLTPNKKYLIRNTSEFSHCVGKDGYVNFSKNMDREDMVEVVFVGAVNIGIYGSKRNIFYSKDNDRSYFSFGTEKLDYIIEEL